VKMVTLLDACLLGLGNSCFDIGIEVSLHNQNYMVCNLGSPKYVIAVRISLSIVKAMTPIAEEFAIMVLPMTLSLTCLLSKIDIMLCYKLNNLN